MITEADLQAGLKMYNVTLREGDAVFINTGWGDLFEQYPAQNAAYNGGEPGITDSAAKWLASQKVVVVGSDTWAVEVIPGEDKDDRLPGAQDADHRQRHPYHRECAHRPDRGCRGKFEAGHVLPVDDGAQGGRSDRHLRQYRGNPIAHGVAAGASAAAISGRIARLRHLGPGEGRDDGASASRFANLDETPGVTLEGLGFTGADVRRSFELAARTLPVDMLYFDNAGDPARAIANADAAIAAKSTS